MAISKFALYLKMGDIDYFEIKNEQINEVSSVF